MTARIAIVGSGVSGLVAAHMLNRRHDVTVFEAGNHVGGHVATIDVHHGGTTYAIDTGFIVYNERNYPNFTRLLAELDVATQPSTMSFSVRIANPDLEYNGTTVRQLFAQRRNLVRPSFYRMLADVLRFGREAPAAVYNGAAEATLGEYVEAHGYSPQFVAQYLVPMGAAIWSSPTQSVLRMPCEFFVRFFENHGMLHVNGRPEWRVVRGGSREYVRRLTRPFADRIVLNCPVRSVRRSHERVVVNGSDFDQVVFACHADQALRALEDPSPRERAILSDMRFQPNDVVVHTDEALLPKRRAAWGAWNYHGGGLSGDPVSVTYNMNILQTLSAPATFCVTLNDADAVRPERVLRRFTYRHPLFTRQAVSAQRRHGEISGVNRTHYCGAYWGYGFHEDGVASALRVAQSIGAAS